MNKSNSHEERPAVDALKKNCLKMLVVIVNRDDGDSTAKFLRDRNHHFQFSCLAQGTKGSEVLDLLGLDTIDKTVVFCIAPGANLSADLPLLTEKFHLHKSGRGIAFTIPLLGFSIPDIAGDKKAHIEQMLHNMENEVDKMNDTIEHSVILAEINRGYSEELMIAARAVGATGGTVIHAKRTGAEGAGKFVGIAVQDERELVAILTNRESRQVIMDTINVSFGTNTDAGGIVLSLPVDSVAGLRG